jgi:hypothetical protein
MGVEVSSRIFNFSCSCRWVVSFTPQPHYPRGNSPRYPLNRRMGRPQNQSGLYREEKNFLPRLLCRDPSVGMCLQFSVLGDGYGLTEGGFSYTRSGSWLCTVACFVPSGHISMSTDFKIMVHTNGWPDELRVAQSAERQQQSVWLQVGFGKQINGYPWGRGVHNYTSYDRDRARSGWCYVETL